MIKYSLIFLLVITLISCDKKDNDIIYKTKGGDYASKVGNFIANFPTEPDYTKFDRRVMIDTFEINLYRSALSAKRVFNIEYTDYPENTFEKTSNEDVYDEALSNYVRTMSESFTLQHQEVIEQHGLDGIAFQLNTKGKLKKQVTSDYVLGRIFRVGNRVYTITYVGENYKNAATFVNSFRTLK